MNLFYLMLIFCPVLCFGSVNFNSIALQSANISEPVLGNKLICKIYWM